MKRVRALTLFNCRRAVPRHARQVVFKHGREPRAEIDLANGEGGGRAVADDGAAVRLARGALHRAGELIVEPVTLNREAARVPPGVNGNTQLRGLPTRA